MVFLEKGPCPFLRCGVWWYEKADLEEGEQ